MSLKSLLLAALPLLTPCLAQDDPIKYTDGPSGIAFNTWPQGDITWGMALPPKALTEDSTEFLGLLTCKGTGYCGISFGGGMVGSLLLLAYPSNGKVLTSFRWATDYAPPGVYTGAAKLTQVSSVVNSTHYSVIFRCRDCLAWDQDGEAGSAPTSVGFMVLGWAHSANAPSNAGCADTAGVRIHSSQGLFGAVYGDDIASPLYSSWAAKATNTVTGSCAGSGPVVVTSVVALPPRPTASVGPIIPGPIVPACARSYKVVAGDYCWKIATENGLSLDQLYQINPGLKCEPLEIGVVVCLRR
ncbi:hypothetical protein B0T16DRAFT_460312 [Cercophora newfieldiana]|uniref:LysM domain-containing protein n=1 Tax=Cercophora newfieldiana TaxID=92897 RepID=A0AA39Y499_9PEZI|nr:hypothetical protein B0T16DRAFT_460312 [Cercophora newfieldiana]